ncbi:transmembrane protein 121B [Hoplias malabaricus]|uniref:transmembrane protein 121B n=1 Tax=Hoplias malabaricus TaxID=27720 RepID=UPI003461F7E3
MIAQQIAKVDDAPAASCPRAEAAAAYPDSPVSSAPEHGQLFLRSTEPLVPASTAAAAAKSAAASLTMTSSGELAPSSAGLFVPSSRRRSALYKLLCFAVLCAQGAALDFYLIAFSDLYWCSWVATDVAVLCGWAAFFAKNSRSKRERACGFGHAEGGSLFGGRVGEFAFAHLAWLVYVLACAPKLALVLETSLVERVAQRAPLGITGLELTSLLAAPLLFCLINALAEDSNGAARHHSLACFNTTCLDVLDSLVLVDALVRGELLPDSDSDDGALYFRHAAVAAHVSALAAPVAWLYELTASRARPRRRCLACARFLTVVLVNAPLLAVRGALVLRYQERASLLLFKNVFFLACACIELTEQCANARDAKAAAAGPPRVSRCVSENDVVGPRGYVNALAVSTQP